MPDPIEVVDDQSSQATTTRTVYTVFHAPYLAGTVHVYVNGMLQDNSWVTELDPAGGTIELEEPLLLRAENDHSLHVAYLTFEAPYVNPEDPIHITQLKLGDVVRVAMRAGYQLAPRVQPRTKQVKLLPVERARAARGFERTVFLAYITGNDRHTGTLYGQVEMRGPPRTHAAATIPYAHIRVIERYLTPGRPRVDDVPLGGGPRAIRRPGIVGKGFYDYPGFMKLIRVKF